MTSYTIAFFRPNDTMQLTLLQHPGLKEGHYITYCDKSWYLVEYNEDSDHYFISKSFAPNFEMIMTIPEDYEKYGACLFESDETRWLIKEGYNVEIVSGFHAEIFGPENNTPVRILPHDYTEEEEAAEAESEEDSDVDEEEDDFSTAYLNGLPVDYVVPVDRDFNWVIFTGTSSRKVRTVIGKLACPREKLAQLVKESGKKSNWINYVYPLDNNELKFMKAVRCGSVTFNYAPDLLKAFKDTLSTANA